MKKATRISYDPYENSLRFKVYHSDEDAWACLSEGSDLLKYENQLVLFSNCVKDIVNTINDKQNSASEGLEIQFVGPKDDYELLEHEVKDVYDQRGGAGPLTCRHIGSYRNANEVLRTIRSDYKSIAKEFSPFLPGGERYEDEWKRIGDSIVKFDETISDAIPVCIIGNYSVGKSALINSLIGEDVLPSKVNPSTAKNVEVIRSDRFRVTLFLPDEKSEMCPHSFDIDGGCLKAKSEDHALCDIARRLNKIVSSDGADENAVIRRLLDALNEGYHRESESELLSSFGCNVIVELPFKKSLLDRADNKIVFYDTPGNDNAEVDQQEHRHALEDLLGTQTNALPILVTERSRTSGRSTGDVMHMLDEYKENFSSPSCLIVLTKCDKHTRSELQEALSPELRNWHGKSIILFTTPIGALGERKGDGSSWLDESYRDIYEEWSDKQLGPKRVCLPDYNCYPCGRRGTKEETGASDSLYNTGIPSLEYEILYYIEKHSKYKKCVRGRKDLLNALATVKQELDNRKAKATEAHREAKRRKATKRAALLAELDAIHISLTKGLDENLAHQFQKELDDYCSKLPEIMGNIYDRLNPDDPFALDDKLNEAIRQHCQKNLIDAVYLANGGAREKIIENMTAYAEDYAEKLQEYVSKNESHFSDYGKEQLKKYLGKDLEPPTFSEVKSVLDSIGELFEKASLATHAILRLLNNPDAAKSQLVSAKSSFFEGRLRDKTDFFGQKIPGLFLETVFTRPINEYFEQITVWTSIYRKHIKMQLDSDNALLSDMETRIEELERTISDLEGRLSAIAGVETRLEGILEPTEVERNEC